MQKTNNKKNVTTSNIKKKGFIGRLFRFIKNIMIVCIFAGIVVIIINDLNFDDKGYSDRKYLDSCLSNSEEKYWSYIKLNKTAEKEDGTFTASHNIWDRAQELRAYRDDLCLRRYK